MTEYNLYSRGATLVLGGSGGLGAACAKRIAADGNAVAITYLENLEAAQKVIDGVSVSATCHRLDIASKSQCDKVLSEVIESHGQISSLVYAIGSNISQPLVQEISHRQWTDVVNNDLNGFINIIQPLLLHMREIGGGSIVHVSSAGLSRTPPRDALSVAPKAAIDSLIKTIAAEEGVYGIRANSVGVGVIEAGIFKRLEAQGVFDDNWKAAVKAALPLKCFGEAEDIAEAVSFFASNRSKYVTGQRLYVDGGYSA